MRTIVEEDVTSADAVKLYHDRLNKKKLLADRTLKNDLEITDPILKL